MADAMVRLQKYLSECGVASRRASEKLIAEGRVSVNGAIAAIGQTVTPGVDAVAVDGAPVIAGERKVCIVLNKPRGFITTAKDTHGRKTVLECLPGVDERVFPVGRLDMDVEGVLLLTNDGELANRLIHPRYEVDKVYHAWVFGHVSPTAIAQLKAGVRLEDGMTAPAKVSVLKQDRHTTLLRLTIHEGRKREVKRMCAAVGHPVKLLQRVAFGPLHANGLRPGEWRYLNPDELAELRRFAGIDDVGAQAPGA